MPEETAPLPATPIDMPLLPLRDVVVFPRMVIPLFVGRQRSIRALEAAMESGRRIMLLAQKTAAEEDPAPGDMFKTGCIAAILQLLKLPDGTVKVLVEGRQRARAGHIGTGSGYYAASVTPMPEREAAGDATETEALRRALLQQFEHYARLKKISPEIVEKIIESKDRTKAGKTAPAQGLYLVDVKYE